MVQAQAQRVKEAVVRDSKDNSNSKDQEPAWEAGGVISSFAVQAIDREAISGYLRSFDSVSVIARIS